MNYVFLDMLYDPAYNIKSISAPNEEINTCAVSSRMGELHLKGFMYD